MKNNSAEPKKKANKIYSNIGLKLLSVVLGFLVWLLVLNIDDSGRDKDHKGHSGQSGKY